MLAGQHAPAAHPDAETLAEVCAALGVTPAAVLRGGKRPAAVAARRAVVRTLRGDLDWSWGRIARQLRQRKSSVFRLAGGTIG